MAEEPATIQQQEPPDKITAIYNTLSKDSKYQNFLPETVEAFALKLQDPEIANAVFQALSKDQKYAPHLPDSAGWVNIFASKKKDFTASTSEPSGESAEVSSQDSPPSVSPTEDIVVDKDGLEFPPPVEALAQAPPEFSTPEDIENKLTKQLVIRQGEVMEEIVADVQAEMDAGNFTELEANRQLESRFAEAEEVLINEVNAEFETELGSLNERIAETEKAEAEAAIDANENQIVAVPNILGTLTGKRPLTYKPVKSLSSFERGLLTGAAMIKAIPDNLGLNYNTGVIQGSNEVLDMLEGKSDDEEVAGYNVGELRKSIKGEKSKAIKEGVEQYNRSSKQLEKYQWGSEVPESAGDIHSFEDFGKFAAFTIGQALPQAVGAVAATGATLVHPAAGVLAMSAIGLGTVSLETGIIQLEMIDRVAKETGKTPEQILEEALTNPQAAVLGGVIAGSLDMLSLGVVLKSTGLSTLSRKFIQKGLKGLGKNVTKKKLAAELTKGVLMATVSEGITEPTQGVIESTAALLGTHPEKSFGVPAIKEAFDLDQFLTEMLAGSIMGFSFAGAGLTSKSGAIKASLEQAILDRKVIQRERDITKIKEGATMTISNKDGKSRDLKKIDGKWKAKNKKGKWVAVVKKDQLKLDNAYIVKQKSKSSGEIIADKIRDTKKKTTKEPVVEEEKPAIDPKTGRKQSELDDQLEGTEIDGTREIEEGSSMTLEDGRETKYVNGKWKFMDKKGKFSVDVIDKSQEEFSNQFFESTQKKTPSVETEEVVVEEKPAKKKAPSKKGSKKADKVEEKKSKKPVTEGKVETEEKDILTIQEEADDARVSIPASKRIIAEIKTKLKKAKGVFKTKLEKRLASEQQELGIYEKALETEKAMNEKEGLVPEATESVETLRLKEELAAGVSLIDTWKEDLARTQDDLKNTDDKDERRDLRDEILNIKEDIKDTKATNKVNQALLDTELKKAPVVKKKTPKPPVVKKKTVQTEEKVEPEKETVEEPPVTTTKKIQLPRVQIQAKLSAAIKKANRTAEQIINARKSGQLNKRTGKPTKKSTDGTRQLYDTHQENQAEVERLRKAFEATKPKPIVKKVAPKTLGQRLEDVKTQIRKFSAALNNPSNKADRSGQNKKAGRDRISPILHKIHDLKKLRDEIREKIGKVGENLLGLQEVDEQAELTMKGKPKVSNGSSQTEYNFKVQDIEGVLTEVKDKGAPPIYFAQTGTGEKKLSTDGASSASDAIRDLRRQKPRLRTQVGSHHLEVTGEPLSSNPKKVSLSEYLARAVLTSERIIRLEIAPLLPRKDGSGVGMRKMKLFTDKGILTTIFITTRGKAHAIGKKGSSKEGQPVDISNNQQLKQYKEVLAFLKTPKKAKPATTLRENTDPDVDHTIDDSMKYTEKGRDMAKRFRDNKIKPPKGALKTVGYDDAFNVAMDVAASIMETGGRFVDAFRAAIKSMRGSAWYKSLTPTEQDVEDRLMERDLIARYEESGIPFDPEAISAAVEADRRKVLRENKGARKDAVHRLIWDRRMAINWGAYETRLFIERLNTETSKLEREILPFIMEKTGVPEKLDRPDLKKAYEGRDVKKLEKIAAKIKKHNDKMWGIMTQNKDDFTENYIDDYITHIWDIKPNEKVEVLNHFVSRNRWASGRYIKTLEEGINKFGLQPKMLDVSEILTIHGSYAINVEANIKLLADLKALKVNGKKVVVHNSSKNKDGTSDWVRLPWVEMANFKVQPEIAKFLEPVLLHARRNSPIIKGLEKLNGLLKGMQLTLSLFHHGALIEAALPLIGIKILPAVFHQTLFRAALKAQAKITGNNTWAQLPYAYQNSVLAEDAIMSGVQLGATMDIRVKEMETFFTMIRKVVEKGGEFVGGEVGALIGSPETGGKVGKAITGAAPKVAEKVIEANNALLWDYLHDNLKLLSFQQIVRDIPSKYNTKEDIRKYKIEQAQFINDSFGGQNWDVLGYSPAQLASARWFLLSPDWTLSTLRQAAPAVLGLPHFIARNTIKKGRFARRENQKIANKIGRMMGAQFDETAGVRARTGVKFWARAMILYGLVYSMFNAWNRKRDIEENPREYTKWERDNKWLAGGMWNNTLGHKTHVFAGRHPNGTERYLRVGKQFREAPEFIIDKENPDLSVSFPKPAIQKLGGKLSPLLQLAFVSFTGKTGSGFENWMLKDKTSWQWSKQYVKVLALGLSPFALNTMWRPDRDFHVSDFIFPSSAGMSNFGAIKALQYYMYTGDWETQKKILKQAVRNKLNPWRVYSTAIQRFKADMTTEIKTSYEDRDQILEALKNPNLNSRELKALSAKYKDIEEDIWQKEYAWDMIIKSNGQWMKLEAEVTGNVTDTTLEEFIETLENRELGF